MAIQRLVIDGYGQFEPNNFSAPRTGRVEAQCDLDPAQFTEAAPAENGMLLAIDKTAAMIKLPVAGETLPIAVHYSAEKLYNQFTPGLKNFKLPGGGLRPRLGYPLIGDTWTTNCVAYDTANYADEATLLAALVPAALATTPQYATVGLTGAIVITPNKADKNAILLKVVKLYTMPDGQKGIRFQVLEGQA